MEKVLINQERCKGCYLCVEFCPIKAVSTSDQPSVKGFMLPEVDQEGCIQCGTCYTVCPDFAITIL